MQNIDSTNNLFHLVSRSGYGFSPLMYQKMKGKSRKELVTMIFKESESYTPFQIVKEPSENEKRPKEMSDMEREEYKKKQREMQKESRIKIVEMNARWLKNMQEKDFGLREKMTLFWHGHFACRINNAYFMQHYFNTLQKYSLSNFGDLLREISKTPAMLQFLNNQQNKKEHPNENFSREVMELFTLGRGNYTEQDIKEAARAFTGWGFDASGVFKFREKQHDDAPKTVLGNTGNFNGDDVLTIILKQPQTAEFITEKVYRFFVNDIPDSDRVTKLANLFRRNDYDISVLMKEIFSSDWFYSQNNKGALIKSPVELLVNVMRVNQVHVENDQVLIQFQKLLGQNLFNPPNVAGWPGGKSWIDSSSLMLRMRLPEIFYYDQEFMAQSKVDGIDLDNDPMAAQKKQEQMNKNYLTKANQRIKATLHWDSYIAIFDKVPMEDLFDEIVQLHIRTNKISVSKEIVESKIDTSNKIDYIKGVTTFVMSTPEYQLS
ncbi:MAG TPA: DUF1800 domain-containing protein [Cytophagaceae bacterium]|jgi:uncharacterized protein (DUF1800 family)|nr:DUF1800 domain-containing protein [Cytophagaceae bacterium]